MTARELPSWRDIWPSIPADFADDGVSSPFQFLYVVALGMTGAAYANKIARVHDYGYGPARLKGSGWEWIDKTGWDWIYRDGLAESPVRRVRAMAGVHLRGLTWFGNRAWRRNWEKMQAWGWTDYQQFLADVDKSYSAAGMGEIR